MSTLAGIAHPCKICYRTVDLLQTACNFTGTDITSLFLQPSGIDCYDKKVRKAGTLTRPVTHTHFRIEEFPAFLYRKHRLCTMEGTCFGLPGELTPEEIHKMMWECAGHTGDAGEETASCLVPVDYHTITGIAAELPLQKKCSLGRDWNKAGTEGCADLRIRNIRVGTLHSSSNTGNYCMKRDFLLKSNQQKTAKGTEEIMTVIEKHASELDITIDMLTELSDHELQAIQMVAKTFLMNHLDKKIFQTQTEEQLFARIDRSLAQAEAGQYEDAELVEEELLEELRA